MWMSLIMSLYRQSKNTPDLKHEIKFFGNYTHTNTASYCHTIPSASTANTVDLETTIGN